MKDDFLADNLLVHIEGETCFELEHFQNRFVIPPPPQNIGQAPSLTSTMNVFVVNSVDVVTRTYSLIKI
jgi:hypothetical protein